MLPAQVSAGTTTNIKTWTNWQSSFVSTIDGNLFNFFPFQTLELISQSLQLSQNPAKDPRSTSEHGTSTFLRRRPWDLNFSSSMDEALIDINPTCGAEAELGIQIATETVLGLDMLDITCHEQSHEKIVHYLVPNQNQIQKWRGTQTPTVLPAQIRTKTTTNIKTWTRHSICGADIDGKLSKSLEFLPIFRP